MIIFHDPQCADYGSSMRPEQPARITKTVPHLRAAHPDWLWRLPPAPSVESLLLAHAPEHLKRLLQPRDCDADTPFFPGIAEHALRAAGAAVAAAEVALMDRQPAFSLMRPPGHHATSEQAMGFCYLNSIAIAARFAREKLHAPRVAIWDFDAHHGNGTEAILHTRAGTLFTSVHQSPCYPGTGLRSFDNCLNWPVAPRAPRAEHMAALRASLDAVAGFDPTLVLVSAGFDAYARDPITAMSLELDDFATLGRWLRELTSPSGAAIPAAAILEGGYSGDLPLLIDAFLSSWEK